tara:strand:+ start:342 stop:530 length:189 start_codon:yes stop_codon:yes gene_type:complete
MRGLEMSDHDDDIPLLEVYIAVNGLVIIDFEGNRHISSKSIETSEVVTEILKKYMKNKYKEK